jgi:hypothetical protein
MEINFHYFREQVSKGKLELEHCKIYNEIVGVLTKVFKIKVFMKLRD